MGFNTIAFLLNDFMHTLEDSPRAVLFQLTHPPMWRDEADSLRRQVFSIADEYGERRPHSQALEVLPTFHADERRFLMAGGNRIDVLEVVHYRKDGTVLLKLPEWAQRRRA